LKKDLDENEDSALSETVDELVRSYFQGTDQGTETTENNNPGKAKASLQYLYENKVFGPCF